MLVRPHALETLQHLVALRCQAARAACASDSIVLQIECVCRTAPAPRARDDLDVQQRLGRGPGRSRRRRPGPLVDLENLSRLERALVNAALGVIQSRSGSRFTTTLKLPLVPKTQPRASKRRPARQSSSAAFAWVTGVMIQIIGASTARASFRVVATMGR